ncbi:MAG: hypothetical protein PHT59_06010, partial [Candidatus Omnitrophica bacterium]|nr:hypothetical protein [Candidatus Omnitrophota bacterium]
MEKHLKQLPEDILALIYAARETAGHRGVKAFLVGGFVRDLILGVRNFDVDITVDGDGIAFAADLSARLRAKAVFHRRFGTATIALAHHHKIDVASARKEFYPEPGCLPVVSRGTLKDDLFRRDFTINTMAISINKDDFGRLIDLFGARSDIRHGIIRILHGLSFMDDPTRVLRAVRFEQRYGFCLEAKTLECLTEAAGLKMLDIVEPQRLRDELILILKEDDPVKPLMRLKELSGLGFIWPGFSPSARVFSLMRSAVRVICRFRVTFSSHRHVDSWLIYLMCLLDGLDEHRARAVCARFVFRKSETMRVTAYIAAKDRL